MPRYFCILLASLFILPVTISSPLVLHKRLDDPLHFRFSSLGDSWAAGPSISKQDAYGGRDKSNSCAQHKASWEALMAGDNTWTNEPIEFNFAACSGAQLQDAAEGKDSQIGRTGTPQLLTIQLGGNNAHFSDVARACIYRGDWPLRQRDYPDPEGTCFKTIEQWEGYIDLKTRDAEPRSLWLDHQEMLNQVLKSEQFSGREDFYIYLVSYAEFFSTSPGSDWCNDSSFGILRHIKWCNELRSKSNELVRKMNAVIGESVAHMKNDRIKHLDPSSLFENHSFCEPKHSINNQYFLNDVWFWNLSPRDEDPDYEAAEKNLDLQTT